MAMCGAVVALVLAAVTPSQQVGIIIPNPNPSPPPETFDDVRAVADVERYSQNAKSDLHYCQIKGFYFKDLSYEDCIAKRVGTKILSSFDSLPTATIESVYANSLSDKEDTDTTLSYIDRMYYAWLAQRFGSSITDLDNVLRTYFGTRVTKYAAKILTARKPFRQIVGEILAEERARLNIGNKAAAAFWNGVNTLRGYRRPIIRYGVECYIRHLYAKIGRYGRRRFCRMLGRLARGMYFRRGYSRLLELLGRVCPNIASFLSQVSPTRPPPRPTTRPTTTTRTTTTTTTTTTSTTTTTTTTTTPALKSCGTVLDPAVSNQIRNTLVSLRVVNGASANVGEYQFTTTLLVNGRFACGATIIDSTHIMTAAHCTAGQTPSSLSVGVAEFDLTQADGEQVIQVSAITDHPNYDSVNTINDISILTLERPIDGIDNAEPVCLPTGSQCTNLNDRQCTVTGWGATATSNGRPVAFPDTLQEALVDTYDAARCPTNSPAPSNVNTQICAVGNTDTCNFAQLKLNNIRAKIFEALSTKVVGDSGGPLVCQYDGTWVQCGITSYGPANCNLAGTNGIYTDVSAYTDWINAVISS